MIRALRRLVMLVVIVLVTAGPTSAAPPSPADIAALVEAAAARPSVHADRREIDAALESAGVPPDTRARLWAEVEAAVLPGMGSRLDGFLFQTRDEEWLAFRDRFAEFLTLRGVDRPTKPIMKRLKSYAGVISFPDVATLDADGARALRGFGADDWGSAVEFPGVGRLDRHAAAEMARCGALVVLPNLKELTPDTAAALARHEGTGLVIGGIARLDAETAAALAGCRSVQGLLIPDLEALDSLPLARRLAAQDSIFLPRLTALDPEIAAAMQSPGGTLSLPGLRTVPDELARQFVGCGYFSLTLGGLANLPADAAATLATHQGPLVFTGTAAPTPEVAGRLDAHEGDLVLQHVARLPADVIARLRGGGHLLVLPGIRGLAPHEAEVLAAAGPLSLPAVPALDVATAQELARHEALLQLDGLRHLSAQVATALAEHGGPLHLGGLSTISADAAVALAACRGELVLDGLTALDRLAAAALLARDGPISTLGLQNVERFDSVELARLAARAIDGPAFPFVTAIEGPDAAAIAAALAESRGTLLLPSLERITPRGLAALSKKADVELPPVESLRIVADPGGGADDFVDPR